MGGNNPRKLRKILKLYLKNGLKNIFLVEHLINTKFFCFSTQVAWNLLWGGGRPFGLDQKTLEKVEINDSLHIIVS